MLDLAIVDKLNRAGFVVAPYNTPEEVPSVKSVSGPARHVGEADKRVRDSRGGSPCGENRCGIGECREGGGCFVSGWPCELDLREITAQNYFFVQLDQYNGQNRGCGSFKS